MSDDDTRWADQLLERARATAAPRAEDAARNLANIEARLGMGPGVGAGASEIAVNPPATKAAERSIAAGAAGGLGVSLATRVARLQGGGLQSGILKGGILKSGAVKGALVLAFGVATGILGYLIGRAETAQHRAEVATGAAVASAPPPAPVATSRDAALPAAPSPPLRVADASAPLPADRSVVVARRAHRGSRGVSPFEREASALAPPASKAAPAAAAPTLQRADPFPLSEALELLRRAEAAVRRSDGLEAKMWLSDLDRRAAPQLLLEERLVTLTLAQCVLGDVKAARETLHELERANAESIYRARLEGSCVADGMQKRRPASDSKSREARH
jgi:hypothetical protein